MKKEFICPDGRTVTITDVSAMCDGERTTGIMVHDSTDVYCDGDSIYFDACVASFDTLEELDEFFEYNRFPERDWEVMETVEILTASECAHTIIQHARIAHGMTQAQLADKIGVPTAWIGKLECRMAKIENITFSNAWKLCTALNLNPNDLLD